MTDADLQRLAELWTEPDAEEQEAFEAMARQARRRGRIFAYLDFAAVAIILGGSVLGIFMTPSLAAMLAAIALIVTTVIVMRKRRQIKQMTRALDTAGRQAFIETSISNAAANLRRNRLGLAFFPLGIGIALFYKMSLRTGGVTARIPAEFVDWAQTPRGILTLVALVLVLAWGVRSGIRTKRELRRLEALRAAYAEQAEHEESMAA